MLPSSPWMRVARTIVAAPPAGNKPGPQGEVPL